MLDWLDSCPCLCCWSMCRWTAAPSNLGLIPIIRPPLFIWLPFSQGERGKKVKEKPLGYGREYTHKAIRYWMAWSNEFTPWSPLNLCISLNNGLWYCHIQVILELSQDPDLNTFHINIQVVIMTKKLWLLWKHSNVFIFHKCLKIKQLGTTPVS